MPRFRVGGSWKTHTIVLEGSEPPDEKGKRSDDLPLAWIDSAAPEGLAQRICDLLNADEAPAVDTSQAGGESPAAAPVSPTNLRVEINADGRHIILEAPGEPAQLIEVALATWRSTGGNDRKPLEAGGGFQLVERATGPTFPDGYPSTAHGGGTS